MDCSFPSLDSLSLLVLVFLFSDDENSFKAIPLSTQPFTVNSVYLQVATIHKPDLGTL